MPAASIAPLPFCGDFRAAFADLLDEDTCHEIFHCHGPRGGGLPKLSGWQWLMGKVFHVMARTGNFADHVKQITGIPISNSALSQRGASVGWELVATALRSVLHPLAEPQEHPDAFHQGLRLIALDGTRFNLCNTAAMKARAVKNRCYRGDGEPAFAQLCSVVVVELGTHQPLAAAFGWKKPGRAHPRPPSLRAGHAAAPQPAVRRSALRHSVVDARTPPRARKHRRRPAFPGEGQHEIAPDGSPRRRLPARRSRSARHRDPQAHPPPAPAGNPCRSARGRRQGQALEHPAVDQSARYRGASRAATRRTLRHALGARVVLPGTQKPPPRGRQPCSRRRPLKARRRKHSP
jgi:hypothetical protein